MTDLTAYADLVEKLRESTTPDSRANRAADAIAKLSAEAKRIKTSRDRLSGALHLIRVAADIRLMSEHEKLAMFAKRVHGIASEALARLDAENAAQTTEGSDKP